LYGQFWSIYPADQAEQAMFEMAMFECEIRRRSTCLVSLSMIGRIYPNSAPQKPTTAEKSQKKCWWSFEPVAHFTWNRQNPREIHVLYLSWILAIPGSLRYLKLICFERVSAKTGR
jgi:hypothetical protein